MIATLDDGGWETVANVQFQAIPNQVTREENISDTVPPPPQFFSDNQPPQSKEIHLNEDASRPSRQYMYGEDENVNELKVANKNIVKSISTNENIIEAEIRQQKFREETIRKQRSIDEALKGDRVSSPSSHTSDEGFVDRPHEDSIEGYTKISSIATEDIVSISKGCSNTSPPASSSEAKIAIEIREQREREAELMALRTLQKKQGLNEPSDEENEESSSTSRDGTDDNLASLITTTDEGNYSECGDHISSEDKSSSGSNSRIMSPDLIPYSNADMRQRRVIVKPYEDDDMDDQPPVYTRMKKESVIEREIRVAKEREEAYRREKGLCSIDKPVKNIVAKTSSNLSTYKTTSDEVNCKCSSRRSLSSSIIQQEMEEDLKKEKELKSYGHIKTLSEDTVENKDCAMTRKFEEINSKDNNSCHTPLSVNVTKTGFNRQFQKLPSSPKNHLINSPSNGAPIRHMTRSFSTTNLSSGFPGSLSNGLRPPKGLMQKFIASKGKITAQTFVSTMQPSRKTNSAAVYTRSVSLHPKINVARSEADNKLVSGKSSTRIYKRTQLTAEEKIQEELREMKKREEELKRIRIAGPSNGHLADAGIDDYVDNGDDCTLPEIHSLRTALSNPNLLDCDQPIVTSSEKLARRKSLLIAQWEDRIQQTNES